MNTSLESIKASGESRELPDYLPARMINEFVYCPRLFYYEQVQGVFVGFAAHRSCVPSTFPRASARGLIEAGKRGWGAGDLEGFRER